MKLLWYVWNIPDIHSRATGFLLTPVWGEQFISHAEAHSVLLCLLQSDVSSNLFSWSCNQGKGWGTGVGGKGVLHLVLSTSKTDIKVCIAPNLKCRTPKEKQWNTLQWEPSRGPAWLWGLKVWSQKAPMIRTSYSEKNHLIGYVGMTQGDIVTHWIQGMTNC